MKRQGGQNFFQELLAKFMALSARTRITVVSAAALVVVGGIAVGGYFLLGNPGSVEADLPSNLPASEEPSSEPSSKESSEPSSEEESSEEEISSEAPVSSKPVVSNPVSSKAETTQTPPAPSNNVTTDTPTVTGDLAGLYAKNSDIRGQIYIPGTKLNEYVGQGGDNAYYLNHNIYKAYNSYGAAFMDYRATLNSEGQSQIITIYAHSNDNQGTYFSAAKQYRNLDFYKAHPTLQLDTIYGGGTYKVVGLFLENVNVSNSFNYWDYVNPTEEQFNFFISQVQSRSFITTPVDVQYGDRFVVLSTCLSATSRNSRYALVARKVRDGEDTAVDTSAAYVNNNMIPASGPLN